MPKISDADLKALKDRIENDRHYYPDQAYADIGDVVDDLIEARAELARIRPASNPS